MELENDDFGDGTPGDFGPDLPNGPTIHLQHPFAGYPEYASPQTRPKARHPESRRRQRKKERSDIQAVPPDETENEYLRKCQLFDEINTYARSGIAPPIAPSLDMPCSQLEALRDFQARQSEDNFGVGLMGTGFVMICKFLETMNERFDPLKYVWKTGLKLTGKYRLSREVEENLDKYRVPFQHLYRKFFPKVGGEAMPWVQILLVTVNLVVAVHMKNVAHEAEENARRVAQSPRVHQAMMNALRQERDRMEQREAELRAAQTLSAQRGKSGDGGATADAPGESMVAGSDVHDEIVSEFPDNSPLARVFGGISSDLPQMEPQPELLEPGPDTSGNTANTELESEPPSVCLRQPGDEEDEPRRPETGEGCSAIPAPVADEPDESYDDIVIEVPPPEKNRSRGKGQRKKRNNSDTRA